MEHQGPPPPLVASIEDIAGVCMTYHINTTQAGGEEDLDKQIAKHLLQSNLSHHATPRHVTSRAAQHLRVACQRLIMRIHTHCLSVPSCNTACGSTREKQIVIIFLFMYIYQSPPQHDRMRIECHRASHPRTPSGTPPPLEAFCGTPKQRRQDAARNTVQHTCRTKTKHVC